MVSAQLGSFAMVAAVVGVGWAIQVPIVLLVLVAGSIVAAVVLFPRMVTFLGASEQLKVERFTDTVVYNGPGVFVMNPFSYRSAARVNAESLGDMDYVKVKDTINGKVVVEKGPKLLFLGPYESIAERGLGATMTQTDYVIVEDHLTGDAFTKKGPGIWFPGPHEELRGGDKRQEPAAGGRQGRSVRMQEPSTSHREAAKGIQEAIALQEDEYIRLKDVATGRRWVVRGKELVFLEPTWQAEGRQKKAWTLKAYEFVRFVDTVKGTITVHRGEATVFPGPNEELLDGDKLSAIDLKANEYVKVQDQKSGDIRVVAGPSLVFLDANEKVLDSGKKKAIEVDDEHAVLVRETATGQQRLVTENQLFVPSATENIEEVRSLIRLADHEAMIIKDKDGNFQFNYGDPKKGGSRSFFLEPYAEVVKLWWSGGLRRLKRDLCIERFDCRSNFMWNEIDCRTCDNVELVLECTIFYEVVDLAQMVRVTGNLPGDVYNQIRSQFIKHVARSTLKGFMEQLHTISKGIFDEDGSFYEKRGVKIHSLEVTKYSCSERRTSEVLQQIIEETTNRLNRLSQAESENEVRLFKMQGQIEQEKLNGELMLIQHEHSKSDAAVAGSAEAERVAAFIKGLAADVPKLEDRMTMWQTLRKKDCLAVVSEGGASLYYTPNDVDLSIHQKS